MTGRQAGFIAAVLWVFIAPASAQGLFTNLYRGLDVLATPSGSPVVSGGSGFRFNGQRSGRLRIVENKAGAGWRLEFDRTFGNDSGGRPEIIDLGNFELELSGSLDATYSFTSRGIPTANANFNVANLTYSLREKSGAQDVVLSGTLNSNQNLEINPLGFYSLLIDVGNTNSQFDADGLLIDGDEDTDFDIGPIAIKGNVYFDMFVAALASIGADTDNFMGIFPRSPIDRIVTSIEERRAGEATDLRSRIIADVAGAAGDDGLVDEARLFVTAALDDGAVIDGDNGTGVGIPEPPAVVLLVLGAIFLLRRTR